MRVQTHRDTHFRFAFMYKKNWKDEFLIDFPGWYRWYASEEDLEYLMNNPDYMKENYYRTIFLKYKDDFGYIDSSIYEGLPEGMKYYCIYIGISSSSIKNRIMSHINGSSELKMTVATILYGNQVNDEFLYDCMKDFIIEYHVIQHELSEVEKEGLKCAEHRMINKQITPLNVQELDRKNKKILEPYTQDLRMIRKNIKDDD